MVLIAARGLAVARGGLRLLEGLDLALGAGDCLMLRGPNGVGKTSLLRTLAGLQPPAAGNLVLPDEGVAYAGHADALKPTLTAAETLAFWAALFGAPAADVMPALAAFALDELADRPAGQLSAGQRRRLGLARLLVARRSVWVLDEPTVSLDTAATAGFAAALGRHLAAGGAAVVATHVTVGPAAAAVIDLAAYRATDPLAGMPGGSFAAAFG